MHNVRWVTPSADEINATRKRMMAEQDQMAKESKINPELVQAITAAVGPLA